MRDKKKYLIALGTVAVLVVASVFVTKNIQANADEKDMGQIINDIKEEVTKDLDEKYTKQLEDKDKDIEELKAQINKQNDTINQLNESIKNTSAAKTEEEPTTNASSATKQELDNAKQELKDSIKQGDKQVEKQITYENVEKDRQEKITPPPNVGKDSSNAPKPNVDENKTTN